MAEFSFTARNKDGKVVKGNITSKSKETAFASLRSRQLQPLVVKPVAAKVNMQMNIKLPGSSGVKTKDLVIFTRQFATMVNAGVPMLRALNTMKTQTESVVLKETLEQVAADVEGGLSLSDSIAKHPKIFSEVYTNMVRAGEAGGILDQIMNRLATQVEKDSQIKSKLRGAMVYPAVISVVAIGAVIFLMVSIVPKITSVLLQNGGKLPIQTKLMLGLSNILVHDWMYLLLGVVILAVAFRQFVKNPKGKLLFHKFQLRMPIFGPIITKVNVARFALTFSSLMGAGVSVIESLHVTAGSLNNVVIRGALESAIADIKNGRGIAESLEDSHILPTLVVQMAAVGEETGQMDTVLTKVAEFYEEEVDTVISSISSIIEPVLIVFLGGVVALIAASVIGPITNLQGSIGNN